jgi:hypothetical protein
MRRRALLALAPLSACAAPPQEGAPPPPEPVRASLADPRRQAVLSAAYAFADTGRLAGHPAAAARATAALEWMAAALPADQAWIPANPSLFPLLRMARADLRASLGIAPTAPPEQVTRSLADTAVALDAGSRAGAAAALTPVAPGGAEAVLARLDRLPQQPRAAQATALAQEELQRMMRDDPE